MKSRESYASPTVPSLTVMGLPVTALSLNEQINLVLQWAKQRMSKVVCLANTTMLVDAYYDPSFASVLTNADLLVPDSTPLTWLLKAMGFKQRSRITGLDVLLSLCEKAAFEGVSIFLLGPQSTILYQMQQKLGQEFPKLQIAGFESLPLRPLRLEEDEALIRRLNESAAGVIFVSSGSPKQEAWMAAHRNKVAAVMVGLGGTFPLYAGIYKRTPQSVQTLRLEWLFQLIQKPGRLWGRHGSTLLVFLWLAVRQFILFRHIS